MTGRYVVFSHGKESGPWGSKITAMAEVARAEGFDVESVDYRGLDDPNDRVTRLLAYCRNLQGRLVLVGSSMGAHVCTAASRLLRAEGLFLLAPAFYMPGYEKLTPKPPDCPVTIVHGWRDDVVPVEHSVRWAREHGAALHVFDSDHRLQDRIREINYLFEYFLVQLDKPLAVHEPDAD
jgi:pimeloyl-ACP methyl ester carboxylesterase